MVGVAGFEPTTLCPPDKCATRLRYTPTGPDPYPNRTFEARGIFEAPAPKPDEIARSRVRSRHGPAILAGTNRCSPQNHPMAETPSLFTRLFQLVLWITAIAAALVGIYCFTLGGYYVLVGIGLYVAAWLLWLLRPRKPRSP